MTEYYFQGYVIKGTVVFILFSLGFPTLGKASHEKTEAALRRGPSGKELRPPEKSQHKFVNHSSVPF